MQKTKNKFYRPFLKPDRLSYRIFKQLALYDGLKEVPNVLLREKRLVADAYEKFVSDQGSNLSLFLKLCLKRVKELEEKEWQNDPAGKLIEARRKGKFLRNNPFVFDMFGRLDGDPVFRLPRYSRYGYMELCLKRAKELGSCTVAWSGGIDSTFLLACFASLGIKVRTATIWQKAGGKEIYFPPKLKKFVLENFENISIQSAEAYLKDGPYGVYMDFKVSPVMLRVLKDDRFVTGAWADGLFFPNQRLKGGMNWVFKDSADGGRMREVKYHQVVYKSLGEYLEGCKDEFGQRAFTDKEVALLVRYAKDFGQEVDTAETAARFLYAISVMPSFLYDGHLQYMPFQVPFFATQDFIDLAYTQYWKYPNSSEKYPRDKDVEMDFIREVFGSDFGVKSNW